jgi:CheY-like chemotaxis protein
LLDLNMPRVDGHEVLAEMKSDEDLRFILGMLTTSEAEEDVLRSYDLHVASIFTANSAGAPDRTPGAGGIWTNSWRLLSENFEQVGVKGSGYGPLCDQKAIEEFQFLKVYAEVDPTVATTWPTSRGMRSMPEVVVVQGWAVWPIPGGCRKAGRSPGPTTGSGAGAKWSRSSPRTPKPLAGPCGRPRRTPSTQVRSDKTGKDAVHKPDALRKRS